ncbi:hypothetical protein [Virgibacillus sp. DJP39]|uniref:hypothetical protein n=1 Tax=Virgibacillus sp. DJP39 TaxID=3409790 RepID=UPI003BB620BB
MANRKGRPFVKRARLQKYIHRQQRQFIARGTLEYVNSYKQSKVCAKGHWTSIVSFIWLFTTWLGESYSDIYHINEITSGHIRQSFIYLSEEQHNQCRQEYGLSLYTVNIRIRLLKLYFTALHKEEVIDMNPTATIKLMKVEEDNFEPRLFLNSFDILNNCVKINIWRL